MQNILDPFVLVWLEFYLPNKSLALKLAPRSISWFNLALGVYLALGFIYLIYGLTPAMRLAELLCLNPHLTQRL